MTYCQRCSTRGIAVDQPRVTQFLCKDFGREEANDQYVFNLLDARLDLPENITPDDWEDNYSGSKVRVTFHAAEGEDMPVELKYHAVSEIQVMAVPLGWVRHICLRCMFALLIVSQDKSLFDNEFAFNPHNDELTRDTLLSFQIKGQLFGWGSD